MFKKFLATFATLLLAAGLSVVAVAAPASAHHTDITATAACTADGGWDITWKVVNSENFEGVVSASNNAAIPKDTTKLPANPKYNKPGSLSSTFVQHVTTNAAVTTSLTVKWLKPSGTVTNSDSATFSNFPAACGTPPTPGTNTVDCSAATIFTGAALKNGDHINMDVVQGGTKFQLNAFVDQRQSQDPASESGLVLRVTQKTGPQLVFAITNAQKQSGSFVFTYSTYLTGKWTVEWVQFNSSYFNQDRNSAKFIYCGEDPADSAASVSKTAATCDAAETLVLGTATNATWGTVTGAYSVTATATDGHKFPADATAGVTVSTDGKTKTFTGTLAPKLTEGCVTIPKCLPASAVTYKYLPATNNGTIYVVNPDPKVYSDELCDGFWVTATSWYYTSDTSIWPQIKNQVNPLPKITSVGEYKYGADVVCGQGDIYASFTGEPYVGPDLFGPNNPFAEHFLHDMGFAGPSPTYTQTALGCNTTPVVEPTVKKITECGTYGSVSAIDTSKVDYTVTGNGGVGTYTVTAVAIAPYVLDSSYPKGGWTFELGAYTDCERTVTITYVPDCAPDATATWLVKNPGTTDLVLTLPDGSTHVATPGDSTFNTAPGARSITVTWGATGSGTAPGSLEARAAADIPANDPACGKSVEPVAPTLVFVDECGEYGSVTTVPKTGVVYETTFDKVTGAYTVVATPAYGYYFENDADQIISVSGTVNPYYECIEEPEVPTVVSECVYTEDGKAGFRTIEVTYNNEASNTPVTFHIDIDGVADVEVAAGKTHTYTITDIPVAGATYTVTAGGKSFTVTADACDEPVRPDPKVEPKSTEKFECTDDDVTITTYITTTDVVFDTELVKWVDAEPVVTGPFYSTRAKTAEDIAEAGCKITVTDPTASTCENLTADTDITSWIKITLDPNVEYTIDGTVVTEEYTEVTAGVEHTVVATALNGYTLEGANPEPDSWTDTTHTWTFTAKDSAVDCIPTEPLIDLEGSFATGVCIADSPWIFYEVTMTDPENQATGHSAKLILTDPNDPTNTATVELGDLVETSPGIWTLGGGADDKKLWPGASVDPVTGEANGWPGWEQNADGVWVETEGNFAWTRDVTTAVLSVNPQLTVGLKYPDATPDCLNGPPEPPTLATVTPEFSYTPLTCTAAGSYTLGELTPGTVQWTVNGAKVAVGTYPVTSAQTLTFVAAPVLAEDGLDSDWVQPEPVVFSQGSAPCDIVKLALTGATNSFGLIWVGLLLGLTGVGFLLMRRRRTATEE